MQPEVYKAVCCGGRVLAWFKRNNSKKYNSVWSWSDKRETIKSCCTCSLSVSSTNGSEDFVSLPWSTEPSLCFHESCTTWPLAQSCSHPWGVAGVASALSESSTAFVELTGKWLHQQTGKLNEVWVMQLWHLVHQSLWKKGLREASWVAQPCLLLSQAPCWIIPFINSSSCGRKAWNGWGCWKWGVTASWVRGIGSMQGMRLCSEEQHNILLMKLESHISRETPKTLIMPERHQGNAVLAFYFWPWVQRIIFFCFNIWLSTTCQQERKKKLVSIPASTVSGLNHERRRLLMRLIHIMMYFTSYS